jgi:hypothetical protein
MSLNYVYYKEVLLVLNIFRKIGLLVPEMYHKMKALMTRISKFFMPPVIGTISYARNEIS